METARGLGELLKTGWKPKRTIILASWDGEEWGLLGSTEWVEKHADELSKKAVVYINSDSTGKGWLSASGSHSLQAFVNDLLRDLQDPKRGSQPVPGQARSRALARRRPTTRSARSAERKDFPIDALGSGSDYTAFLDLLTVASLNMGFGGDGGGGIYHSIYDSFYWYTHFSDTDFAYSAALSRTMGTALLRLADADVLPFEFTATAHTLREYVNEIDKLRTESTGAPSLDLTPIRTAIDRLDKAAQGYNTASARLLSTDKVAGGAKFTELNRLLYTSERAFKYEAGLPRREWFKHLAYAPGFYTGYGVKTLPGIREGLEQKQWDEARTYVPIVAKAIGALADQVQKATAAAEALVQH